MTVVLLISIVLLAASIAYFLGETLCKRVNQQSDDERSSTDKSQSRK